MALVEEKPAGLRSFEALRDNQKARGRLSSRGVNTFLLASRDGLLIDAVTPPDRLLEVDSLAAYAAAALDVSRTRGDALNLGPIRGIVVEFEQGHTIVVDPVAEESLAVYVGEASGSLGQLSKELPHLAPAASRATTFIEAEDAPPAFAASSSRPAPASASVPSSPPAGTPAPAPVSARTAAAAPAAHLSAAPTVPGAQPAAAVLRIDRTDRVVLRNAMLETAGFTATASVELELGDRRAVGKAVGRNIPEQALSLAAEAAVRAVTEFLPTGYGVVLESIQAVSSATEIAIWANVMFITPTEEQLLPGIARLNGNPTLAAAKAVLAAINRRLTLALND